MGNYNNKTHDDWVRKNCMRFGLKIRNDSGIPYALEKVRNSGESIHSYIVEATKNKLIADGYLQKTED